jgi:hypothetical protein
MREASCASMVPARVGGVDVLRPLLRYLFEVREDDLVDTLVRAAENREIEALAMSYKDRLIERGREEGLQQGREQGLEQGLTDARAVLEKMLQLKFAGLDDSTIAKLRGASSEQVRRWSDRVLTADTLSDVFAER